MTQEGCSFEHAEMAERLAAWGTVFQILAGRERTPNGFVLRFEGDVERDVRRLAALEGACCRTLTFRIRRENDQVVMKVDGPWEETPWRMAMTSA